MGKSKICSKEIQIYICSFQILMHVNIQVHVLHLPSASYVAGLPQFRLKLCLTFFNLVLEDTS